jgi:hypothetical protein
MPSGFQLTLNNCDIYYLSAVNYDSTTADLIFTRVNITQGQGWETNSSFLNPFSLLGSLFTLRPDPTILAEVTIYPGGRGKGFSANFSAHWFYKKGHYLPCGFTPQY